MVEQKFSDIRLIWYSSASDWVSLYSVCLANSAEMADKMGRSFAFEVGRRQADGKIHGRQQQSNASQPDRQAGKRTVRGRAISSLFDPHIYQTKQRLFVNLVATSDAFYCVYASVSVYIYMLSNQAKLQLHMDVTTRQILVG